MPRRAKMPGKDGEQPSKAKGKGGGAAAKSSTPRVALSEIPDDVIRQFTGQLVAAQKALEVVMEDAASKRGVIRGVLDAAQKAGIPKRYLKEYVATMRRPAEEVRQELEFIDRAARINGNDQFTHQLDLFRDPKASPVKRPVDEGYAVGKSGGYASENPYQPGTEENQQWSSGWSKGQAEIVGTMAPKDGGSGSGGPTAEDAIEQGKKVAQDGGPITSCPCPPGPAQANWQSGWKLGHTDRARRGGDDDDYSHDAIVEDGLGGDVDAGEGAHATH